MVLTPGIDNKITATVEQFWEKLLLAATQLSPYLWILNVIP